ncbi:glyoxal reductase-like [Mytilus californianus]|uniref:glyoxal reductase-like n=1 Tax=Mytilus californianus TaxID=6549 RepID=UPI002247ACAF|nr:glyoxal reductase-like [Mytilus californianus]
MFTCYCFRLHTGMVTIAKGLQSRITLADGNSMPMFGLGMFESSGIKAEKAVEYALSQEYRLIDTAEFHGIEEDIGRGIEKSGVNRKEIFVVNKLWENGYDRCKQVFMESLRKMKLNYIDLYCIHNPAKGNNVETYKAMIELQEQGIIKSLGVSNFGVHHLEAFKSAGLPKPVINQIELHPWQQKTEIVNYCRTNGIALMGYSPLCKGRKFNNKLLIDIADRYKRSAPQILIRWSVQHGFVTIPKSSDQRHIDANANVFDWSLKEEDIELMNTFPDEYCTWNPCVSPWNG